MLLLTRRGKRRSHSLTNQQVNMPEQRLPTPSVEWGAYVYF